MPAGARANTWAEMTCCSASSLARRASARLARRSSITSLTAVHTPTT